MGYELWVMPLLEGEDPTTRARQLVHEAQSRAADPERERRKQRLADLLIARDPALRRFPKDAHAIATALPELTEGEVAHAARTLELYSPGVTIALADEWVDMEVATWPVLGTPETVERLTTLVELICLETGWTCVDGERNEVMADPRSAVERVTGGAVGWGARVAADIDERNRKTS